MYFLEVFFNKRAKYPKIVCPYEEKYVKIYKKKGYILKKKRVTSWRVICD